MLAVVVGHVHEVRSNRLVVMLGISGLVCGSEVDLGEGWGCCCGGGGG